MQIRNSWQVTKSVYYALFLREMLSRLFANQFAWFWLFAEPLLMIAVMISIRTFIRVMDSIGGVEMIPWLVIGLSSFFMFREGMSRGMGAVNSNQGLFAYRQIKPIDAVIVRIFTGGLIHFIVLVLFIFGLALVGYNVHPHNLLEALGGWITLWFFGLGVGLVLSVAVTVVDELRKIVNVMSLPLMILSGGFLPIHYMPYSVQQIMLYNPILHGVELIRLGYFDHYWTAQGISYEYLFHWTLGALVLGIALHLRYEMKLKAK